MKQLYMRVVVSAVDILAKAYIPEQATHTTTPFFLNHGGYLPRHSSATRIDHECYGTPVSIRFLT